MNTEPIFTEKQKFTQWWIWLLLIGINIIFLFGVFKQVICDMPFGDKPMSNTWLVITTCSTILLTFSFLIFKLETHIKTDGIYVRFFPFHLSFKKYSWARIEESFVREYNPLMDYGGWGLRLGIFGKGKAYNVSGNKGIQLVLTNGKRLLIGTNKPETAKEALRQIGRLTQ